MARTHTSATESHRAARVEHIIAMMQDMRWVRGASAKKLAAEWKVTLKTVKEMSAEASRAIAREYEPDALKGLLLARLEGILLKGEDRDAIKAADVMAHLMGLHAAQKVELSMERMQFEALPPPEQAKRLREKAAECVRAAEEIERGLGIEVKELPQ